MKMAQKMIAVFDRVENIVGKCRSFSYNYDTEDVMTNSQGSKHHKNI